MSLITMEAIVLKPNGVQVQVAIANRDQFGVYLPDTPIVGVTTLIPWNRVLGVQITAS